MRNFSQDELNEKEKLNKNSQKASKVTSEVELNLIHFRSLPLDQKLRPYLLTIVGSKGMYFGGKIEYVLWNLTGKC